MPARGRQSLSRRTCGPAYCKKWTETRGLIVICSRIRLEQNICCNSVFSSSHLIETTENNDHKMNRQFEH